jgi:drug/metabolite transporter (DMT)-like permease
MQAYKIATATSVTIAGNVSKALGILCGFLLFHTHLEPAQFFGLFLCMGGGLYYALIPQPSRNEKYAAPSAVAPVDMQPTSKRPQF